MQFARGVGGSGTAAAVAATLDELGLFVVTAPPYNADPTGGTDSSAAIQAAIDAAEAAGGGVVFFPGAADTVYLSATTLVLKSGVHLMGKATIRASASLPDGNSLLKAEFMSGTLDVYENSDSTIEGLTFDGNDRALTTYVGLVRLFKFSGLKILGCTFKNHRYILLALGGCRNVCVDSCELTEWGKQTAAPAEGGPAIWVGLNPTDATAGYDIAITGCDFHDSEWCGIYALSPWMHIDDNDFRTIKEAAVYSRWGDAAVPDADSQHLTVTNNRVDGVVTKTIQAAGFEIGSRYATITGNQIKNCEAPGIDLTDPCADSVVSENIIVDTVQDETTYAAFGQITVRAGTGTSEKPKNITVCHNRVRDTNTTVPYGIRVYQASGSETVDDVRILNNDLTSAAALAANNLEFQAAALGSRNVVAGNLGHASATAVVGTTTLAAATGNRAITGIGFQPRLVEIRAVVPSATAANRCSGYRARNTGGSVVEFTHASTGFRGGTVNGSIIRLVSAAGATVFDATLSSFDADGFTLNVVTASTAPEIIYVCHP